MANNEQPYARSRSTRFPAIYEPADIKILRNEQSPMQELLLVNAKDRKHQVWERNSLSISLWSDKVLWQKIDYIHQNPVKAGLCKYATDYYYSSAAFYFRGNRRWDFLAHVDG
jgi:hypothetical protein